jgi:hypothetical protein
MEDDVGIPKGLAKRGILSMLIHIYKRRASDPMGMSIWQSLSGASTKSLINTNHFTSEGPASV